MAKNLEKKGGNEKKKGKKIVKKLEKKMNH